MLESFLYQNYLEMKPVAFVSPYEAITKRKVWILSFHSKFILKINALQFNWFNKTIHTKVSHHRGTSPGIQEKTNNKTPAKTVCGKPEFKTKTQPHLNFRNLHAETEIPKEVWKGWVSQHLRIMTSFCTASQEQNLKNCGLQEKPFQQSC